LEGQYSSRKYQAENFVCFKIDSTRLSNLDQAKMIIIGRILMIPYITRLAALHENSFVS